MEKTTQIYGIRAVIEAINANEPIDKVFIQRGLKGDLFKELEGILRKNQINTSYVPIEKLNRLTKNNHQGVVANISPITFHEIEALVESVLENKKTPLFLLLDQLSDVRNFGAIIRTAECTGVDGIIIQKKGAAPVTADTIKTSAGSVSVSAPSPPTSKTLRTITPSCPSAMASANISSVEIPSAS